MPTSEIVLNEYIGDALKGHAPSWGGSGVILSENTGAFTKTGLRPDIVVCENIVSPIVIETEYLPAATVEKDAAARLGQTYVPTGGEVHVTIAVRVPSKMKTLSGAALAEEIRNSREFEYCILAGDSPEEFVRWPETGFVSASIADIATAIKVAKISPVKLGKAVASLEYGANSIATLIEKNSAKYSALSSTIPTLLKQSASLQTYKMAAAIIINALVFHETLVEHSDKLGHVASIYDLDSKDGVLKKSDVVKNWARILDVNYWPIFGIAREIVAKIPNPIWQSVSQTAFTTAEELLALNIGKNPDLVGTVFQRLIADRRFLATFYTSPPSASLLATLLVGNYKADSDIWSEIDKIGKLKIADFACGTGSLLTAIYASISRKAERSGVDMQDIHKQMIEESITGCDVLPSATHITATQISSVYPTIEYEKTSILTMPFGISDEGIVSLGSFDLLETQGALSTLATSAGGVGATSVVGTDAWKQLGGTAVDDQSYDLIGMNPPFTRLTGGGGKTSDINRPLFAAFETPATDQAVMAKTARKLFKSTSYDANAGAASAFVQLKHNKLKEGGRFGLVLPLSAAAGSSWQDCRDIWHANYDDLCVISIASDIAGESAFSADTGIAECLVLGTRASTPGDRVAFVTLYRKPISNIEGIEIGRKLLETLKGGLVSGIDEGPIGGTHLYIGDEKIGEVITSPTPSGIWNCMRVRDHSLAQSAHLLATGSLWLPGMTEPLKTTVKFCTLSELGTHGPYHLDVSGPASSGGAPRGPFEFKPLIDVNAATYVGLVAHDESRERFIEIEPDKEAVPRTASTSKGKAILSDRRASVLSSANRLHISTDFRFNANALPACLTTRKAIGGRAWPSFNLTDETHEKLVCLWLNSSLGILSYWWAANRTQDGRGSVTTTQLGKIMCIDPRSLSEQQLKRVDAFFDKAKGLKLANANEIASDDSRKQIDNFFASEILGTSSDLIAALGVLRAKLERETTIQG